MAATKLKKYRYSKETLDGNILNVLQRGVSFGELGVLYGKQRTASCVAINKVVVLGLGSEIFRSILGDHVKYVNRVRFEILAKMKMFLGWDRSKLGGLLDHIQVLNPIPNTYLYRRGSTNKDIYIIVNGEIELMVPIILSQNQVLKNTEKIAKNLTKNTNSVNLKEYR